VDDAKKIRSYQYQSELVGELRGMLSRSLDQLPFVQRWQYVHAKDLHFWTPGDEDTTFVDIYLLHPKLVRMARDLLENPKGMQKKPRMSGPKRKEDKNKPEPSKSSFSSSSSEEWRNRPENWDIPPWFDPDEFGVEGLPHVSYEDPHGDEIQYRGFDVFEADVPFLIRELVDKGEASGCVWYHVPANKWQPIVSQASRLSDCPLEISVRWEDWKQATDKKYELLVPDLKKLALDIEVHTLSPIF
jgi:DNA polymerase elongation subunit (family B)